MSFELPYDLSPDLYPLAWLVGTWRGPGVLAYPDIPERPIVVDVELTHDGGPYLAYTSTISLLEGALPDREQQFDPAALEAGAIWSRESGFWRPSSAGEALPVAGAPADAPSPSGLEVIVAEASGAAWLFTGSAQGPRVDIASQHVGRTATAADVVAQRRMYGWVRGEIFFSIELAAFGHELQSYATGRLTRSAPGA
ncbi:FABP family protein [Serinibacter arcticus]|uniref:FABP family protein n=1 Tax=Serinibacter arcticus TaxID=1655435 RepID=A0A2U1ZXW4_9MICO|nr:FABP family protein [Serinibacter arcticus]PWD51835.1 FABP family protein [Serinibacter arcticus]